MHTPVVFLDSMPWTLFLRPFWQPEAITFLSLSLNPLNVVSMLLMVVIIGGLLARELGEERRVGRAHARRPLAVAREQLVDARHAVSPPNAFIAFPRTIRGR